jgi:hypothetical protein
MKKKIFLNLMFLVLTTITLQAQQNNAFTKDIMPISPEVSTQDKIIRNPNAQTIVVNGVTVDKRVGQYYQEGDFAEMSKETLLKLNVIYLESYVLVNTSHKLDSSCQENIKNNFDLGLYNRLRKNSERVTTPVFFQGCSFIITLFSWDEINNIK